MKGKAISVQEKAWRAESDARTLADAKAIQADPKRMKAAATAAKSMVEERQKELNAMKGIAKKAK